MEKLILHKCCDCEKDFNYLQASCPYCGGYGDPFSASGTYEDAELNVEHKNKVESVEINNIGINLFRDGKLEDAIDQFQKAIDINPFHEQAYSNIGYVLIQMGDYERAIKILELVLSFSPFRREAIQSLTQARELQSKENIRKNGKKSNENKKNSWWQFWKKDSSKTEKIESKEISPDKFASDLYSLLPLIPDSYYDEYFGEYVKPENPTPGQKKIDEAIAYGNKNNYEEKFNYLKQGIELGLGSNDLAYAHEALGEIYIKRKELLNAINEFLLCLAEKERSMGDIFQSSMRLYYIYNAVNKNVEALKLLELANFANKRVGLVHLPAIEEEIVDLVRNFKGNDY
jgi:tetratricopeptide (TPR) repeat protein